jgi:hypothetical protein
MPNALNGDYANRGRRLNNGTTDRHFQPLWLADDAGSTGRDGDF